MTEVLRFEGIEKAFGPNQVLRGVTFSVRVGDVHALLGENGAGKSTLMRVLLGLEAPDRGAILLAGSPYRPTSARAALAAGVVLVPQERTLCPHLTVTENIVLGVEPSRGAGVLDRGRAAALARAALDTVTGTGGRIHGDVRAGALGVADQQLVEIARALFRAGDAPRVLVLDEPTSSLGHDDATRLFERVAALTSKGLAVLLVTHYLGDVRAHAARYTVLRDGRVQGEGEANTTAPEQIVREMLGRELEEAREEARAPAASREGEVALAVRDLAVRANTVKASFVVHRGEVFGIAGLVGSGRTELLRAMVGLDRRDAGSVDVRGRAGLLSEDRGGEGLMLGRSIGDNIALSSRGSRIVSPARTDADGARWIAELAVRASGPRQRVTELSGGNQQKVQLARLLREDYDVLLIDEPTRGIDVASKAKVLALVRELARRDKAIVLVSSQLDELVSTCDTVAVLRRGQLGEPLPAASRPVEQLLLEAST